MSGREMWKFPRFGVPDQTVVSENEPVRFILCTFKKDLRMWVCSQQLRLWAEIMQQSLNSLLHRLIILFWCRFWKQMPVIPLDFPLDLNIVCSNSTTMWFTRSTFFIHCSEGTIAAVLLTQKNQTTLLKQNTLTSAPSPASLLRALSAGKHTQRQKESVRVRKGVEECKSPDGTVKRIHNGNTTLAFSVCLCKTIS